MKFEKLKIKVQNKIIIRVENKKISFSPKIQFINDLQIFILYISIDKTRNYTEPELVYDTQNHSIEFQWMFQPEFRNFSTWFSSDKIR